MELDLPQLCVPHVTLVHIPLLPLYQAALLVLLAPMLLPWDKQHVHRAQQASILLQVLLQAPALLVLQASIQQQLLLPPMIPVLPVLLAPMLPRWVKPRVDCAMPASTLQGQPASPVLLAPMLQRRVKQCVYHAW